MIHIYYTKYKQISATCGPLRCTCLSDPSIRRRDFDPHPSIREPWRPMRFRQLTLLALASLLGCDDAHSFTPPICTAQFVYGISVDVVDSGSGAPLADSATMTLRDGNYVESATLSPDGLTMNGAGERAGNYTVVVARPRYHNWVRTEVQVDADECHVIPIKLRAELQEISR